MQWLQGTSKREGCVIDPPHVPSKKDFRIYYQETTRAIAEQASQIAQGQKSTTFFCEDTETVLQAIASIELAKKGWVESVPTNNRVWSVLVHQILALTLQFGAISAEQCWQQLSVISDFSGIKRSEFEKLIAYMVRENFLFLSQGLFSIGDETEKTFGRRNFMEIYAVFSSPQLYKVSTEAGYVVGSLEQNFVDL